MKRLDEKSVTPQPRHRAPVGPAPQPLDYGSATLSDRQAVIAIMFANGLTCEEISDRLAVALDEVHGYLIEALRILKLSEIEDLTFAVVASYYRDIASTGRRTHSPDSSSVRAPVGGT